MLFTALSRAAGVPSRTVWGIIKTPWTPSQPKGNFASHNWSEVYFPGSGWIPVDPQHPESLGWLPSSIVRIFMDSQRTPNTPERLPMRNLVAMNGERINFEVEP
jgi:transglutaminase-like putative cysteine protease